MYVYMYSVTAVHSSPAYGPDIRSRSGTSKRARYTIGLSILGSHSRYPHRRHQTKGAVLCRAVESRTAPRRPYK